MSTVDTHVFMRPSAAKVAALVESHSLEAAIARWYWLDKRTIFTLAQAGRAAQGVVHRKTATRRAFSDLDAAVCVEASYALGSMARGERASGVPHNSTRGLFPTRGLDYVRISTKERAQATMMGIRAKDGDTDAKANIERRREHELAVGEVLRRALALVGDQPATGRYVLPPVDAALRESLVGLPGTAIGAVFPALGPGLAPAAPMPSKRERAVIAAYDGGLGVDVLAAEHGIQAGTVKSIWSDAGLSGRARRARLKTQHMATPVVEAPVHPRLDNSRHALAVRLARAADRAPMEALTWFRADAAASRHERT
ncbi:hypothetical protein [Methylobacterium sp. WL116]|uniref:hypothetical protein n=1 Tax=Methylobacterium sp. WL116 TaxID=2603889 RepID=UPI0011C73CE9|nr:hypothetical protein [Methylobacterium sp. WL116]TXM91067.1 hypothetical protein FV223_16475 [Methylobacterium sp. WL116]